MNDAADRPSGLREESDGRGWGAVLLRLGATLLVLGVIYVGAAFYFKDRPPAGVTVAGVDIGGLDVDQARATLSREFGDRTTEPITVEVSTPVDEEPVELEIVPQDAGLTLDLDETLDGVTGLSFNPARIWAHVAGQGRELPLVGAVDRPALDAALATLAEDYDTEPVEGEVSLSADGVEVVDAVEGRTLDLAATAEELDQAWRTQVWDEQAPAVELEERTVAGTATTTAPALTAAEVTRFTDDVLDPALSDPVVVEASRGRGDAREAARAELGERDLLALLSVTQDGGALSLAIDEEATLARLRQDLGQLERGPRDATVALAGSSVDVVPSRVGYALEEEGLVAAVEGALAASGEDRTIDADIQVIEPQIPTSVSEGWDFTTMSTFTSQFPTGAANEARTANLRAGVQNVNGTVVMPGEQFSLASALGDISPEAGYVEAPIILDGRLVMGLGGGLSQISTVVFNASWFAGVQLDAHTPHSFYIARYPAGREATIAVPVIDNLWTNDTDTPIVVRSFITGDEIVMSFLGDRQYSVETVDGQRRDVTEGERTEDDSEECVAQNPAEGFTIVNTRILESGGREVSRDEFTTTYQAADEIVCTNPEAPGYGS